MNAFTKSTVIPATPRETPLPSLISGRIRVKNAERFLKGREL
jgi:hypothetical protein